MDWLNSIGKIFEIFTTLINFCMNMFSYGQEAFLNVLNFLNYFFFDFLADALFLFDFLPPVFSFGISIMFYFMLVVFILKIIKLIPFL